MDIRDGRKNLYDIVAEINSLLDRIPKLSIRLQNLETQNSDVITKLNHTFKLMNKLQSDNIEILNLINLIKDKIDRIENDDIENNNESEDDDFYGEIIHINNSYLTSSNWTLLYKNETEIVLSVKEEKTNYILKIADVLEFLNNEYEILEKMRIFKKEHPDSNFYAYPLEKENIVQFSDSDLEMLKKINNDIDLRDDPIEEDLDNDILYDETNDDFHDDNLRLGKDEIHGLILSNLEGITLEKFLENGINFDKVKMNIRLFLDSVIFAYETFNLTTDVSIYDILITKNFDIVLINLHKTNFPHFPDMMIILIGYMVKMIPEKNAEYKKLREEFYQERNIDIKIAKIHDIVSELFDFL